MFTSVSEDAENADELNENPVESNLEEATGGKCIIQKTLVKINEVM